MTDLAEIPRHEPANPYNYTNAVRKPLLLLLVPLNVLHLVLLLLQPLARTQEHEEPLLDTDRDFTMSIS